MAPQRIERVGREIVIPETLETARYRVIVTRRHLLEAIDIAPVSSHKWYAEQYIHALDALQSMKAARQ